MSVTKRWRAHIEAWERSGLTQTAYCQQHELNKRSFAVRLSEHCHQSNPSMPKIIPVEIETTDAATKEVGFIWLHLAQGSQAGVTGVGIGAMAVGVVAGFGLIGEPPQIWLAVVPVDMRRGIGGLSTIVQEALGKTPCSGMAFVFRNKAGNRLRLLVLDGNGVWLCQRRLHRGSFIWPKVGDASFCISRAQWGWLVAGVDWQRLSRLPNPSWQV